VSGSGGEGTAAPSRPRPSPVLPAAPRLAARARAERSAHRSRWARRTGLALLVLLPLLAVAWVLLVSSWLAVDRVEVSGVSRLTAQEVRSAVALAPGTPLARISTDDVADAVRRLPPVAEVQVRRSWPGTLEVRVRERTVAAGVVTGASVRLVDAAGVAFATERALPPGVVRLQTAEPGPDDAATRAALQVHQELPPQLRQRVAALTASTPAEVVLVLDDGRQVAWGAPGHDADKAAAALALLRMPGTVVDVSTPGLVVRR